MKILSWLLTLRQFQTYKTFVKLRYFWLNLRAFSIDSNTTDTFKAQKGSKDIVKIVRGSTITLQSYENIFVSKENVFLWLHKITVEPLMSHGVF